MNYVEQLDTFVQRLRDAENDYKESQSVLSELLDMIEAFNGAAEYEYFLKNLVPVFLSKLETVPISFSSSSPEHKLRNLVLEIIHRSIMTETFQPYSESILVCLTKVLENENEDNGVLCMKIITSLHKAYKTTLADKVEPFVLLINRVYDNMDEAVERVFSSQPSVEDAEEEAKASSAPGSLEKDKSKTLAKAMMSFKTLAECPITMVSLYSSYKSLVQTSLPVFLPKIIHILLLQVPQQKQFREELLKSASSVTAILPQITNRQAYSDFILGQVKAASFLAYVFIRGYASQHLPAAQANVVPDVILRLLQDCPAELSVARKELLHATRHILSTPSALCAKNRVFV